MSTTVERPGPTGTGDGIAEVLVARSSAAAHERPLARRALIVRVLLIALAIAVAVSVAGGLVARWLAESEAIRDVTVRTDDIAHDLITPVLQDGLANGDRTAVAALDDRVRGTVLGRDIARVKVWAANGTIVYSDEPRLIGQRFDVDAEERETLESGGTEAEVSDLDEPENRYERGDGPLLEVYRAVHTPDGTPLLFEVYYRYDDVLTSAEHIWLGFAIVIPASLLLLLLALIPLLNGLVRRVERAREERERSLRQALDASDAERRRIAATLHDGAVQDLIGASYRIGAAAGRAHDADAASALAAAEDAVRASVESLRGTLLDLYPATLDEHGLAAALGDHVAGLRSRGAVILLDVDDDLPLTENGRRLAFRVVRETLANAVKHAGDGLIHVRVAREPAGVVATVEDRGPGFDAAGTLAHPPAGHFGLRLLQDAVTESGVDARLTLRTAPAAGTVWRLVIAAPGSRSA
jgi:two-component system, NarL family, sensor kinase